MPGTSYIVYGIVYNNSNTNIANARITFSNQTESSGSKDVYTTSNGKYLFDLANIGWSNGDTIAYEAYDEFNNEMVSSSFVISGENKELNITLEIVSEPKNSSLPNRGTNIYNIGGNVVSLDNPLPVTLINTADLIDLTNNPNFIWEYDSKGRIISDTITIRGVSYKRTYTYTGSNWNANTRSKWVRQ